MTFTAIGVAIGLGVAATANEILVSLLFDVSHLDPTTTWP